VSRSVICAWRPPRVGALRWRRRPSRNSVFLRSFHALHHPSIPHIHAQVLGAARAARAVPPPRPAPPHPKPRPPRPAKNGGDTIRRAACRPPNSACRIESPQRWKARATSSHGSCPATPENTDPDGSRWPAAAGPTDCRRNAGMVPMQGGRSAAAGVRRPLGPAVPGRRSEHPPSAADSPSLSSWTPCPCFQ
jgi:hypothetical protein